MKLKASRIDYSKAMLPRSRKEQLGDCFKMSYLVIFKCGLLLFLFFLPLIGYCVFMDFFYISLMNQITEDVEQTKTLFFYIYYFGIFLLTLPVIISIGGITHILRNLIWGEGIFFMKDFGTGIKQNISKNIIFGLIGGLMFSLAYFVHSIFDVLFISYLPLVIFALVFLPIYFWIIYLNNTYASKWTVLVKNGFFFYAKTIGWSLLGILMPLSLITLLFVPFSLIWLKYIILALFIVFVFPIIFLIMTLYTTSRFDQYINQEHYPDYYLKGLKHD